MTELDNPEKSNTDFMTNRQITMSPSVMDIENPKNIANLVITLAQDLVHDRKILYFLIFVCAAEQTESITNLVKEQTDNFEGYEHPEDIMHDPTEIVASDPTILDLAFKFTLQERAPGLVKYVLDGAKANYITATINDDMILTFLEDLDSELNVEILRLL